MTQVNRSDSLANWKNVGCTTLGIAGLAAGIVLIVYKKYAVGIPLAVLSPLSGAVFWSKKPVIAVPPLVSQAPKSAAPADQAAPSTDAVTVVPRRVTPPRDMTAVYKYFGLTVPPASTFAELQVAAICILNHRISLGIRPREVEELVGSLTDDPTLIAAALSFLNRLSPVSSREAEMRELVGPSRGERNLAAIFGGSGEVIGFDPERVRGT